MVKRKGGKGVVRYAEEAALRRQVFTVRARWQVKSGGEQRQVRQAGVSSRRARIRQRHRRQRGAARAAAQMCRQGVHTYEGAARRRARRQRVLATPARGTMPRA